MNSPWSTWANRVTTVRLIGTVALAAGTVATILAGPRPQVQAALCAVALLCEALDGVDGWLARRLDQATAFGARYDMEVDSAMMLVLSVAVVAHGLGAWWVLLIGGWRYGYVLASLAVPALRRRLPYRYSRKVVAATVALVQIGALALGLLPVPYGVVTGLLVAALAALSWSFLRDIVWQLRQGPRPAVPGDGSAGPS